MNSDQIDSSFLKFIKFSATEQKALKDFLKTQDQKYLKIALCGMKQDIESRFRCIVASLDPSENNIFNVEEIHALNPALGAYFGKLLVQNENGDSVISVYDRDRLGSMFQGARYHQTREGGSIHTDNVNVPEIWDYLYFSCISPAHAGGENILVDGILVHKLLSKNYPEALGILEQNFIWEMRGVSDALYHAPIITYNSKKEPLFRHLRPYLESAHRKANIELSDDQLYALDVLDALLNCTENQFRYRMRKGDILLTRDAQVLHGRTCFSDARNAVSFNEYDVTNGKPLKRTMERLWIQR